MAMHKTFDFPEKHPRWATDALTTVEPTSGQKDTGWPVNFKAPARWMNWLQNMFSRWSSHIGMTAVANWWQDPDISVPLFVAVAGAGTDQVMTSSDGITWLRRTEAQANVWRGITYSPELGLFVAVSNNGTDRVMTSPDGINWTSRSAAEANSWESVTWGDGLFVAVASAITGTQYVMTSPDGITWTIRTEAQANAWESVTWGDGLFVAVSSGGANRVMTSPDGITWTVGTAAAARTWTEVTYSDDLHLFVAVCDGTAETMTSPDGITWTTRTAPNANQWASVTWGNERFVAVSKDGVVATQVMTSPDGILWTARTSAEANTWTSVTFHDDLFVAVASAVGGTNYVMTSPDGITWTIRVEAEATTWYGVVGGDTVEDIGSLIYHPGIGGWLAASSRSPRSFLGKGGHEWTPGAEFSAVPQPGAIGIDPTYFLVGDVSGNIQYSPTGVSWSLKTSATIGGAGPIYSIATRYPTDDAIMVMRTNATVFRAIGGISSGWSAAGTPPAAKAVPLRILHRETTNWMAVAADGGNVVCKLYLSTDDGDIWAASSADPTAASLFYDAGYNPETATIAIAGKTAGGVSTVEYSTDLGSTWNVATITPGFTPLTAIALYSIYYCGGDIWVICGQYESTLGERALILVSNDDCVTWTPADSIGLSSFTSDLHAIACDGQKLICAGDGGVNLHSLSIK